MQQQKAIEKIIKGTVVNNTNSRYVHVAVHDTNTHLNLPKFNAYDGKLVPNKDVMNLSYGQQVHLHYSGDELHKLKVVGHTNHTYKDAPQRMMANLSELYKRN